MSENMDDAITITISFDRFKRFAKYYYGSMLRLTESEIRHIFLDQAPLYAESLLFNDHMDYYDLVAHTLGIEFDSIEIPPMVYTPTPLLMQEESTKNCPYCGSEHTHYVREKPQHREEWKCDSERCGESWERPPDEAQTIPTPYVFSEGTRTISMGR